MADDARKGGPGPVYPWQEPMAIDGFVCTKDFPWRDGLPMPVEHVDAAEVEGSRREANPGVDVITLACPHCGTKFDAEVSNG